MPRKSSATKSTTKSDVTKPQTPKPRVSKKQQQQDDLEQRFLNPLLRVAIEPEAKRRETEPGWEPIDRLGELGSCEGYYERCERVEGDDGK